LFACLGECFYPSSWSTECESKKTKNKIIIWYPDSACDRKQTPSLLMDSVPVESLL
jgi:hypothetical protein